MLGFLRRLLGRESVSDVAALFPDQLRTVKLVLYRWFAAEYRKRPGVEPNVPPVIAGQVVNYLTGENLRAVPGETGDDARGVIEALRPQIPEIAANLMRQDRNLREIVVQTIRMRLILNLHCRPEETQASGLKQRLVDLLQIYGGAFPEEPSPRRYHALVGNLIAWAQSPQFPGRGE